MAVVEFKNAASAQGSSVASLFCNLAASGSDRAILVGIVTDDATNAVASVTYGVDSLSRIKAVRITTAPYPLRLEVWGKLNPTNGTNSCTVNFSATCEALIMASTFAGVSAINEDDIAFATGNDVQSISCTSSGAGSPNMAFCAFGKRDPYDAYSLGSGQTERTSASTTGGPGESGDLLGSACTKNGNIFSYDWTAATDPENACIIAVPLEHVAETVAVTTPASATFSATSVTATGGGQAPIIISDPAELSISATNAIFASLREARKTLTDMSEFGRFISIELSRSDDGPEFEVHLVDVDVKMRGHRRWKDF